MAVILKIIMSVIGTIAFSVTMKAPKNALKYIAAGSIISAATEHILSLYTNDFFACLISMIVLSLFCEIIARIIKEPTTVIIMPSTIPLLPGSYIYYTMFYAINGEKELMQSYAGSTLLAGLGIALGAIISSAAVKIFFKAVKKKD